LNPEKVVNSLVPQLKEFLNGSPAVLGVSGGVDSAVVLALCVRAVHKQRILPIIMPYGIQSIKDSVEVCKAFDIDNYQVINIQVQVDSFCFLLKSCLRFFSKILNVSSDDKLDVVTQGNVKARVRMMLLYAIANSFHGRVIGTTNKSEYYTGYFTKWGDGACDCEPIIDLYKTEVYEIAEFLNVPICSIAKPPSAELWEGQTDEQEMGVPYNKLDLFLANIVGNFDKEDFEFGSFEGDGLDKVIDLILGSSHKRVPPVPFSIGT